MPNEIIMSSSLTDVAAMAGLEELWAETLGDPRICIAVLDGPVDRTHPSLATARLTQLETLVSGIVDGGAASQHGTHVASVIFGDHDGPVKGIAPRCRGLIIPIFEDGADGSVVLCSQLDLASAIIQAVQQGAHIINISGGELSDFGTAHPILADAVRECANRGVLIVAAAGNEGCDCLNIPGALPSVLSVGAMNLRGEPMGFSNWGERYQTQGILAPGENILGAATGGGTVANSGTSYATPIVSGIAALLLSMQLKGGQKPNPQAVREAILNSAVGCDEQPAADCRRLLAGRLYMKGALSQILQGGGEIMSNPIKTQKHPKPYLTARYSRSSTRSAGMLPKGSKPVAHSSVNPNQIGPSNCTCGGSEHGECTCESGKPHLVYALGMINYDFGTEARKDSIMEVMRNMEELGPGANPYDPLQFLAYLKKYPFEAASVIWTLELDGVPIYAIEGLGAFGSDVYQLLRQFLCEQIDGREYRDTGDCVELPQAMAGETRTGGRVERVAIPGYIVGSVMLSTGQVVPVVSPARRGMFSWNTDALVEEVLREFEITDEQKRMVIKERIRELLQRVYEEFRNLGVAPQERAMNYLFTNIFSTADSVIKAFEVFMENLALDTAEVAESPVSRPNSEYWEVKLVFFSKSYTTQFRKVFLITVDVSDVVPVTIGGIRSWLIR